MSLPETYQALFSAKSTGGKPELKEVNLEKPGDNQVLIKVAYAPIHRIDTYIMDSSMFPGKDQVIVGFEGSGTVVAVGQNLEFPFKVGDKVLFRDEAYSQYKLVNSNDVYLVPSDLSLEEAAAHWANPATVAIITKLIREGNHKAVVHTAGSSPIGRMIIRYLKKIGIPLINVVRREEYIEELKREEGAEYVLNSQDKDFEKDLKDLSEKLEATVAFDPVGGELTDKVVKALPEESIIYMYGGLAARTFTVETAQLLRWKTIKGLFLPFYEARYKEKGQFREFAEEVHSLLPSLLSTKVQKVFKLEELDKALEYYYENASKGKVLISPN